ncbi:MAG: immunoglobulin domain-containing protein [Verrucomicrobia bacterium]|nr:immunoglobulin domain-containing protein [Verrucomicrobiota bacterium]
MLLSSTPALAIDGTFTVTETWKVKLTYSHWGDQNYSGVQQFSGTQVGKIVVNGGSYVVLDQSNLPVGGLDSSLTSRTISPNVGGYSISGGYVFGAAFDATAHGIVFLGCFVVSVPLIDGEVPVFSGFDRYSAFGSSYASINGSGSMKGSGLTAEVTSSITWVPTSGPPSFLSQPANQTVVAGAIAGFDVTAGGTPLPGYQWQRKAVGTSAWVNLSNGGNYSGVTTGSLRISGTTPLMSGDQFRCVAANASGSITSNPATLIVNPAPSSTWVENWQAANVAAYAVTDNAAPTIPGDGASWLLYDSADVCGGPHANSAQVISLGGNRKALTLSVVNNPCVDDISLDSIQPLAIPLLPATMISVTESGSLANPQWNGFFPTLFPPPGDSVHLVLTDQNGNQLVYFFQRAVNYAAHSDTFPVRFADGRVANAGYHEVLLGAYDGSGGTFTRNIFDDFKQAPGFNPSGATIIKIQFGIRSVGSTTLSDLKIGTGLPLPPEISLQPSDQTAPVGKAAVFAVAASGNPAPTFQWQRQPSGSTAWSNVSNGGNYAGATTTNLVVSNVTAFMSGDKFRCVVSNSAGTLLSAAASLTVNTPSVALAVVFQPTTLILAFGQSGSFSVTVSGTLPLSYQWLKNGVPIINAAASSYILTNVQYGDVGEYSVLVSNASGSTNSNPALLLVSPAPLAGAKRIANQFIVDVLSASGVLYVLEWKESLSGTEWTRAAEATGNGGVISLMDSSADGLSRFYRVRILSQNPTTQVAPAITQQPQPQTISAGATLTLSIDAEGGAPLAYQWFKDGSPITRGTNSLYTVSNAQPTDAGNYYVTVSNPVGSTNSVIAVVAVTPPVFAPDSLVGGTLTMTITSSTSSPIGSKTVRTFNSTSDYSGTTTSGSAIGGTYTYTGTENTRTVTATQQSGTTPGLVQQIVLTFESPNTGTFAISRPPSPAVTSSGNFELTFARP